MDTDTIFFVILFLGVPFFFFIRYAVKQSKIDSVREAYRTYNKNRDIYWEEHPEERRYPSGKYLTGHPDIDAQVLRTEILVTPADVVIFSISIEKKVENEIGRIPISKIKKVSVEDKSTMENRVTASRLLLIGLFAFAAKKKEYHPDFYLVIEWMDANFEFTTIFEFSGNDLATKLCNVIIRQCRVTEV